MTVIETNFSENDATCYTEALPEEVLIVDGVNTICGKAISTFNPASITGKVIKFQSTKPTCEQL